MTKIIAKIIPPLAALTLFAAPAAWAQSGDQKFKDEVKTTIVDTVNASKDFFSGLVEGLEEAGESPKFDPAHVVANKADLDRLLKVEIVKLDDQENGRYLLTVALRNPNGFPVKVTGLSALGNVVLLDKDGFSYPLPNRAEQGREVIVLARSATRLKFFFNDVEARPAIFRLFDADVPISRW